MSVGQFSFERDLAPGAPVQVRWTAKHESYSAPAVLERINAASYRVRLTWAVGGYAAGAAVSVPKVTERRWSASNGVFPR